MDILYTDVMHDILRQIDEYVFIQKGQVRNATFACAKEAGISKSFDCICCEITIQEKRNRQWDSMGFDKYVIRIIVHEYIHVINWIDHGEKYNYWVLANPKSIDKAVNMINKHLKLIKTF